MKKNYVVIIIICVYVTLGGVTVFDLIRPQTDWDNGSFSFDSGYYDYYYMSKAGGEKQYWYSTDFLCNLCDDRFTAQAGYIGNEFYINYLAAADDEIKINSGKYLFGLGFDNKYKINFQQTELKLNYSINKFIDYIPISFITIKSQYNYKKLQLLFAPVWSVNRDSRYLHEIGGYTLGAKYNYIFSGLNTEYQIDYNNISADLNYLGKKYCELNGLQMLHYSISGDYAINKHHTARLGVSGISMWQRERSCLDAMPFVEIYSLGFGSKTFIKSLDAYLVLPFVEYDFNSSWGKTDNFLNLSYSHFIFDSNIVYTERIWLMPELWPDDSTKHEFEIDPELDGIFRVQIKSHINLGKVDLILAGSQLLPVDFSKIKKAASSGTGGSKTSRRGGTRLMLSIGYNF